MSYEKGATNYDEFGNVKDDYPNCEWVVISIKAHKAGPNYPLSYVVTVGAFPYTFIDGGREYADKPVKKAVLLNIRDLFMEHPDLYATVGTAIHTKGATEHEYFIGAIMA